MNFVVENKTFLSTIYLVYTLNKIMYVNQRYQLFILLLLCVCNVHLKDTIFTVNYGFTTIRRPGLVFFFQKYRVHRDLFY